MDQPEPKQQFHNEYLFDSEFLNLDKAVENYAAKRLKPVDSLSNNEVEKALSEIYRFYAQAYRRAAQPLSNFDCTQISTLKMQSFLLFAKHFQLKAIFSVDKLALAFKKQADFGKQLTFQNFYFLINSLAHESQAKTHLHTAEKANSEEPEVLEEVQKQELYHYLLLQDPVGYRQRFADVFTAFESGDMRIKHKLEYNYRKFSVPQLRKRALPEVKQGKKEKEFFIAKNNKQPPSQHPFDEPKSIVVSWDSLRAKSVGSLNKPVATVERKYVRADPEDELYLAQYHKDKQSAKKMRTKIEQKVKEIQANERIKNKNVLRRLDRKIMSWKG